MAQACEMGHVEHCIPPKDPVLRRGVGQVPRDVGVVSQLDGGFFFDACPRQPHRNALLMISQDSLFSIFLFHVWSFPTLVTKPMPG